MNGDRWLCGWRIASELPLPELVSWRGEDRAPDITISIGVVPRQLPSPLCEGPLLQVAADGTCRYAIEGIAAYLVEDGRRIVVQPWMDAEAPDIRVILLGSVLGFLCHQRGLLPLHAGCVAIGGRAVALAGRSGVGKSTLTAAFALRGYPVLTDDVTVVDVAAAGGPRVLPTFPRLKLWRDVIDVLGLSAAGLERSRLGLEKYNLPLATGFPTETLPLAAIYCLDTVNDARRGGITPLRGMELLTELTSVVYRRMMAIHSGRQANLMNSLIRLAATPVMKLSRVPDFAGLGGTVAAISTRHEPQANGEVA